MNWHKKGKHFGKFVNQIFFKARNILEPDANTTNEVNKNTGINAPKKSYSIIAPLHRARETKYKRIEIFIQNKEKITNIKI